MVESVTPYIEFIELYRADLEKLRGVTEQLLKAAQDTTDPNPCGNFDHHGYCQEHSSGKSPCYMGTLKEAIAATEKHLGENNG